MGGYSGILISKDLMSGRHEISEKKKEQWKQMPKKGHVTKGQGLRDEDSAHSGKD